MAAPREYWMEKFAKLGQDGSGHAGGVFNTPWLLEIEKLLPEKVEFSAETGCGKSTILFSNLAERHLVFAFDDREKHNSSVNYFLDCPLSRPERVEFKYGPTQLTLRHYAHVRKYDIVLLDGPHGWPFPELEYYFFYPQVKEGGILIIDDIAIPTIGRMADIIAEDAMWSPVAVVGNSALFRRTAAPVFNPMGDGWWEQDYNRRRVSPKRNIFLNDRPGVDAISSLKLTV